MPELLSLVRSVSSWHFLLAVCLVDVAFLLLQLTSSSGLQWLSASHSGDQEPSDNLQDHQLRRVLDLQAQVRRGIEDNSRRLRRLILANKVHTQNQQLADQARTENLKIMELLQQGVDDLEANILRLQQEYAGD